MIITDIERIDRLARDLLNDNSKFISMDMTDREYSFFKRFYAPLQAVLIDAEEFTPETIDAVTRETALAGGEHAARLLLHIDTHDTGALGFDQIAALLESLHHALKGVETEWEIGSRSGMESGIRIFALIGQARSSESSEGSPGPGQSEK